MHSSEMNEELKTGVDEMDREHALELQIVRAIQAALASKDRAELPQLLEQLQDFTNAHFLAEQLLMRLHSYPGFEAHQREHDDLMEELRGLGETLLDDDAADPAATAASLERWLIAHIQSEDQALAEFLRQQDGES
jgi:hemerythrin